MMLEIDRTKELDVFNDILIQISDNIYLPLF